MKKLAFLLSAILGITACGVLWEYRELHEINGMRWSRNDVQTFEMHFEDQKALDAYVLIRHVYGISINELSCTVEIIKDGTSLGSEAVIVPIKDEEGEYVGEGSVDLWDVQQRFLSDFLFEPGNYSFDVSHSMPQEQVPLIMEVGLQLEKPSS